MSSNLPVATGGGAVVTLPASEAIASGSDIGDMSVDRGAGPRSSAQSFQGDIQRAAGIAISRDQIQRVQQVLQRYRLAEDQREKAAAEAAIKVKWGAATEGNLIKIHGWLLDTMGKELAHELLGARDSDGTGICNKAVVLEAMLEAAFAAPAKRADNKSDGGMPDHSAISSARLRELDSWMGNRDPRYWKDEEVQREYRDLLDRGVTGDVIPKIADAEVTRRMAQIETLMSQPNSEYYRGANAEVLQREYRELIERRERGQQTKK